MINSILVLSSFVWIIGIAVAYLFYYPPMSLLTFNYTVSLSGLKGNSLYHIFVMLLFVLAANGWGMFVWRRREIRSHEKFLFATAIGTGIMSMLIFLGNVVGITHQIYYFSMLLLGGLLSVISFSKIHSFQSFKVHRLLFFAAPVVTLSLIGALAPPTQYDSLVYHLALPAQYLAHNGFYFIPHNIFLSFPQNIEMLFQMALAIDGDVLANLFHWIFMPLTGYALYAFCTRFFSKTMSIVATLIWFYIPAVLFLSTGTYVDIALAFYIFLAFFALMIWWHTTSIFWLILSALLVGISLGTKYTAVIFAIPLFVLVFYHARSLRSIMLYLVIPALVITPWLLKSYFLLHNPIAPWGTAIFTDSKISSEVAHGYLTHIHSHGGAVSMIKGMFTLPWKITMFGHTFGGAFDQLGPIFLVFIPSLILMTRRQINTSIKSIMVFLVFTVVIWFFTGKVLRFLTPTLPFLSICAAMGIQLLSGSEHNVLMKKTPLFSNTRKLRFYHSDHHPNVPTEEGIQFDVLHPDLQKAINSQNVTQWLRSRAVYLILIVLCIHNTMLGGWVLGYINPTAFVIGPLSRDEYLTQRVNYYAAIHTHLKQLSSNTKIALLGETRGYFFTHSVLAPTVFDRNPLITWLNDADNVAQFVKKLHENNITHVLINTTEFKRLNIQELISDSGKNILRTFTNSLAEISVSYRDPHCTVYELPYERTISP